MADTMPQKADHATSADTATAVTVQQQPKGLSLKDLEWHVLTQWVAPALFRAPGLDWGQVENRNIRYLRNAFLNYPRAPWGNALALVALVMTCHEERDPQTVYRHLAQLHARWRALFPAYGLIHFCDWQPVDYLPRYVHDRGLPDTPLTRGYFVQVYEMASLAVDGYLRTLPARQRSIYLPWAPPPIPHDLSIRLGGPVRRVVDAKTQERRRRAADAVTPHFANIRGEAHRRWNQLWRLREQYRRASHASRRARRRFRSPSATTSRRLASDSISCSGTGGAGRSPTQRSIVSRPSRMHGTGGSRTARSVSTTSWSSSGPRLCPSVTRPSKRAASVAPIWTATCSGSAS